MNTSPSTVVRILTGLLVATLFRVPEAHAQANIALPDSGTTTFGNWDFSWGIGNANDEGLVLTNVRWKRTLVISKVSMPVVRVKYRGNGTSIGSGCGPYSDRIHSGNIERLSGATSDVVARFFGNDLMEIAVLAEIGGYDLYQAYYFHKSGRFEPTLYSSGWSCRDFRSENDHKHHPYWRIDFDVDGIQNHVRHLRTLSTGTTYSADYLTESGFSVPSNTTAIVWTVASSQFANPNFNRSVRVYAPSNEHSDTQGSPWFGFCPRDIEVRQYRPSENVGWAFGAKGQLGYFDPPESTAGQDVVFWAIGHLTHLWSQDDVNNPTWHSGGWIVDVTW